MNITNPTINVPHPGLNSDPFPGFRGSLLACWFPGDITWKAVVFNSLSFLSPKCRPVTKLCSLGLSPFTQVHLFLFSLNSSASVPPQTWHKCLRGPRCQSLTTAVHLECIRSPFKVTDPVSSFLSSQVQWTVLHTSISNTRCSWLLGIYPEPHLYHADPLFDWKTQLGLCIKN